MGNEKQKVAIPRTDLIYLKPFIYALRMICMIARKHNQIFTFLIFHPANNTSEILNKIIGRLRIVHY